ncbi:26S proteasome regulatory subunit 4-like protein [Lachnellula hyalina]|uniref:26S proteasome regulatory subunit 4-like protein n=1 Tax=Lachnellula hyalina TaxID=1316788 RepID=A0A8H8QYY6_9HELO|nr:26S proteasome regulatory subunit 4-like protein [Lachnellula hyalina]TVY25298.1 26S proteasome regulatory subunit 4-like protein [Lachnellula hyalina]
MPKGKRKALSSLWKNGKKKDDKKGKEKPVENPEKDKLTTTNEEPFTGRMEVEDYDTASVSLKAVQSSSVLMVDMVQGPTEELYEDGDSQYGSINDRGDDSQEMVLETFELWRTDRESPWDVWIPDDVDRDPEEGPESRKYVLIVRREKDRKKHSLSLHSITVQSPLIRKVLDHTFDGYEGMSTKLKELTFYAPFHEFYNRWHLFQKLYLEERDIETREHLGLLVPIIRREVLPHIEAMKYHTQHGVIPFTYLWAIFPPGLDIYSKADSQDRIYRVKKSQYSAGYDGRPYFLIRCRYIDGDGDCFGYVTTSISMNEFDGVKKITDLNAVPSHLHPGARDVVKRLHSRGKKFEKLNGYHMLSYSGFYNAIADGRSEKRHTEGSRIIVDPKVFAIYNSHSSQPLDTLETRPPPEEGEASLHFGIASVVHKAAMQAFKEFDKLMKRNDENFSDSSEFYVDNISPIEWSKDAFQRLVLPGGYKEIIHAFVTEQLSSNDTFDDIVQGKGQGFIMLLSGEPGVGKTLTVESVADEMRKPLYSMSAGELGEGAGEVERSLETVLELTNRWGAILLLDECDIFLEKRTTADIQRNRLVSLFLKQLEYYRGVMFLTTNRVSTIDSAFESRIHLAINYPNLDFQSRLQIWQTFIRPCHDTSQYSSKMNDKDLERLAKNEMNGRQIKNVVKTARLLAKQKNIPLAVEHIEMVLKVKSNNHM